MNRIVAARRHDWEYWYTIVALLFLTNALYPLLYDLVGVRVDTYGDSNPLNLLFAAFIYLIAGLLILKSPGSALKLIQQNPFTVVLLLLPLCSELWSVDPGTTFRRAAAYTLTGVFCVYLAGRLSPEVLLKRLMFVMFIGGVASILYAILLPRYGITPSGMNAGTWRGVFGQKNDLGRISSIALVVSYFVQPANLTERVCRILTMTIFAFLLVLAQSRTNWLIMSGMIGLVPLLRVMRNRRLALSLRVLIVLSFSASFALIVLFGSEQILAAVGRDNSFSGRETLWRGVTAIVNEHYPVLGAGYGAFWTDRGGVQELDSYLSFWSTRPDQAHSGYLNVRADLGAAGLYMLITFIVVTSLQLLRCIVREPHRAAWPAFACLVFFFVMNNITETVAFKHSDITWAIMLIVAFHVGSRQKQMAGRAVKVTPISGHSRSHALKPMMVAGAPMARPSPGSSV